VRVLTALISTLFPGFGGPSQSCVMPSAVACPPLCARESKARHGWASRKIRLVERSTPRGLELHTVTPPALFRGIPTWRTAETWLAAGKAHPRLYEAAKRYETCPARVLQVQAELAPYADAVTGRDIAVAHKTIAEKIGVCKKQVQRCCWALEDLGLLVRVLDGSDMKLEMRMKIRDFYPRRDKRGTRSYLPNVYAATLPRWLAIHIARVRPKPHRGSVYAKQAVDNTQAAAGPISLNVHPPEGGTGLDIQLLRSVGKNKAFRGDCGQTRAHPGEKPRTKAATRPQQGRIERSVRRLDPAVRGWCRALRASLPGFHDVSLHRVANALSLYVRAGLSTAAVRGGLDQYLAANELYWRTYWGKTEQEREHQALYLVEMLKRARIDGYIRLTDDQPAPWRED